MVSAALRAKRILLVFDSNPVIFTDVMFAMDCLYTEPGSRQLPAVLNFCHFLLLGRSPMDFTKFFCHAMAPEGPPGADPKQTHQPLEEETWWRCLEQLRS